MFTQEDGTHGYSGPERRAGYGWHLDKRVTVTQLIGLATLAATIVAIGYQGSEIISKIDTRIAIVEQRLSFQTRTDAAQDADRQRLADRLNVQLRDISAKLDRMIEWQMNHNGAQARGQ